MVVQTKLEIYFSFFSLLLQFYPTTISSKSNWNWDCSQLQFALLLFRSCFSLQNRSRATLPSVVMLRRALYAISFLTAYHVLMPIGFIVSFLCVAVASSRGPLAVDEASFLHALGEALAIYCVCWNDEEERTGHGFFRLSRVALHKKPSSCSTCSIAFYVSCASRAAVFRCEYLIKKPSVDAVTSPTSRRTVSAARSPPRNAATIPAQRTAQYGSSSRPPLSKKFTIWQGQKAGVWRGVSPRLCPLKEGDTPIDPFPQHIPHIQVTKKSTLLFPFPLFCILLNPFRTFPLLCIKNPTPFVCTLFQ